MEIAAEAALPLEARREAPSARLSIRGLSHRFDDRQVLSSLSLDVAPGEIRGLLGPNGSGKSTTFRVLVGQLVPSAGELFLDGDPISPGDRRLRERLGVVFQSSSLDPKMSARENLILAGRLYRLPASELRERSEELLAFADLRDRAGEQVAKLSGGMRRKLELARALLHRPDVLLLDEPTTGLDEGAFQRFWDRVLTLRDREGLTVLLTTHRPEEAERCDRITALHEGRRVAEGTPDALRSRVSGDVLTLTGHDPDGLARDIAERFSLPARVVSGAVMIEAHAGHEIIPRLVEAFPEGRIATLSMRRPTLADVFLKLTGTELLEGGNAWH